ncbi:MAG: hypothetical protein VB053_03410 [Oscillibacter ruminantium]|uniref:hypothetical protein n=1 Tax=Oscillibacter ruminantium TaxID=1263547 RepID=UPI002B215DF4|nr:hypothetical protein [Oscillibacter ruminantium]MEA5041572.1 hypothetical protein [Oscillibacter ruminantium]
METDLIHRDELRCRAEAWAEDVFAGEPDNCKYNSLMDLIDDSEVVGATDVETEKLIAALRNHANMDSITQKARMMCHSTADALERLIADNAEKDAEIERLREQIEADSQLKSGLDNANALCRTYGQIIASFKDSRDRLQAELDAAVEYADLFSMFMDCEDETFLEYEQWRGWRGKENGDGKENS